MRVWFLGVCVALLPVAATEAADQGSSGNQVAQSVRQAWDDAKRNITESGDQMPEEHYGFQPTKDVRTFGQILAHIAGANYVFCSAAKGEKSPFAEEAFEKSTTTRAGIIKALAASMTYCDGAYAVGTDAQLAGAVDLPFGAGKGPRIRALLGNIGHLNEHYGNLVTYFRMKGIVPPSSRR
jgi:uncharacterized damage-inducible protein DinB